LGLLQFDVGQHDLHARDHDGGVPRYRTARMLGCINRVRNAACGSKPAALIEKCLALEEPTSAPIQANSAAPDPVNRP